MSSSNSKSEKKRVNSIIENKEKTSLESGEIEEEKEEKESTKVSNPKTIHAEFENLVKIYYSSQPYMSSKNTNHELEVRFGTRGIKRLTKNNYDNVIQKLKSLGFRSSNEIGEYSLKIENEFLDKTSGKFKTSKIRTEINGLNAIQEYCKNNDIKQLIDKGNNNIVKFVNKKGAVNAKGEYIKSVNFDDFNFRVSYQIEETTTNVVSIYKSIVDNWQKSKKQFRYLNRVTFIHPDYPINVDISIVKSSKKEGNYFVKTYTVEESKVFSNPEVYEIELEVNNKNIGPGNLFNDHKSILESLRKVIKMVLSGLQKTNYPVSYKEQDEVIHSYMKLLQKESYNPDKRIYPNHFIGPSSTTLQMKNIIKDTDQSVIPNIRKNYTVTEKADGDRHLLYVAKDGKIYLINTNMNVIFTGAFTNNKECLNSLIDGELILHNKLGEFINLYAAFDIYYLNNEDVRLYGFMLESNKNKEKNEKYRLKSRYMLLKEFTKNLKPISILHKDKIAEISSSDKKTKIIDEIISPIRIETKKFYPLNPETDNIFGACNAILSKVHDGLFEYNTDGMIFTPAFTGVGSDKIGISGPLSKITWEQSFKWKPPEFNTIDFLVTTIKGTSGEDVIKPIFTEGKNVLSSSQLNEYKSIVLRCTFVEKKHGYINPCQDVIDDNLPNYIQYEDNNSDEAKPVQFYPTNPYDENAGICNIMLRLDDNHNKQMFTEINEEHSSDSDIETFSDNMIVEFKYDVNKPPGWRWIPIRVRHDKTAELQQGMKNYGNAYHVANSNWQSIHNPITENIIRSGLDIPETISEVYYNRVSKKSFTKGLRDFHNSYVKKLLITSVSKKGDSLIDYACGKAGDLPKWISANLSFVFGIDISKDNLENRLDGACARFLNFRKEYKHIPYALFVNGNSSANIRNGNAMLNDKAIKITKCVFGEGNKDEETLGKGVVRQYGKGQEGFNISSCQFALHYFFESVETFQGFLRNVSECTKVGGYFIGTSYDGKLLFKRLKNKKYNESIQIMEDGVKIWEVTKMYGSDNFEDNVTSLGYKINVYQETINQTFPEYLINFDYLTRIMEDYGFILVPRDEAKSLGLPEASGLFSELFVNMIDEIKRNKYNSKDYGEAENMKPYERDISFLNRYFVYKKVRNVNATKIEMDLGEISEYEKKIENKESKEAIIIAKKENKEKREKVKIKKLNQKIILQDATEALDDSQDLNEKKSVDIKENKIEEEEEIKEETIKQEEEIKEETIKKEEIKEKIKKPRKLKKIVIMD